MAKSAEEAIKKDKMTKVDDVYIDADWKADNLSKEIGYNKK